MPAPSNPVLFAQLVEQQPLNAAEEEFVAHMKEGKEYEVSGTNGKHPVKALDGKNGEKPNIIRADLIRFFAWGGDKHVPIRGNIIGLQGAYVSGILNLENVPSGYALALAECHFDSPIKMSYAKFRVVNLDGSRLMGGLLGGGMQIDRDMYMSNIFVAKDGVDLLDANIGGSLYCYGGKLINKEGSALTAHGLKVEGNLHMENNFSAEGGVRLLSATIGGGLYLSGGKFHNKKGYALVASGAKIGGDFVMKARENAHFCANGGVDLIAANIAGDLVCRGTFIKNIEDDDAFVADAVKIGGSLSMNCDKDGSFYADGNVQLIAANIGVNWNCTGGKFNGNVVAESATIGNSLFWLNVGGKGECILSFATANIFDYDEQSLRGFEFVLDGFSYNRFAERKSVAARLNWLKSRPTRKGFSPQPFEQAAKVLFEMGQGKDARTVLFEAEKIATEESAPKNWRRWLSLSYLGRRFLGIATGYNYLLGRMFWASIFVIALGVGIFGAADKCGYIVPHQPVVLANPEYKKLVKCARAQAGETCQRPTEIAERVFPDYPRFNAALFSLDIFLPTSPLHQEAYWYPQLDADTPAFWRGLLSVWYAVEIIAGWLLVSLITLTYTGILQRRQTGSGGK